jgi:hypothetical protein
MNKKGGRLLPMNSNVIIITSFIMGLSIEATPPNDKAPLLTASNHSIQQSYSERRALAEPPLLQDSDNNFYEKAKTFLCLYCCCPCLTIRACCPQ